MRHRFALKLVNFDQPLTLVVSYEGEIGSAVLLQKNEAGKEVPVAMVGKRFSATQTRAGPLEKLLVVASWAARKLKRYTAFVPATTLLLPTHAEALALGQKDFTPRLASHLLELQLYLV